MLITRSRGSRLGSVNEWNWRKSTDDSPVSSYRSLVFASSPSSAERLANLDPLFEGFSLSSEAVAASASLSELSAAFLLLIEPFLLLVVGAGFFLLFSLAYASFLSRRREFAILSSLGARQGDLLLLTSLGPALVSFLSSLLATGLSPLLLSGGSAYDRGGKGQPAGICGACHSHCGIGPYHACCVCGDRCGWHPVHFGRGAPFISAGTEKRQVMERYREIQKKYKE